MTEQRPSMPPSGKPRPKGPPVPVDATEDEVSAPPKKSKAALIGWVVSIVLVIGVVVGLLFATGIWKRGGEGGNPFGDPSADTTMAGALDALPLAIDIAKITAAPPPGSGAEMTYRQLIKATYPITVSYKAGDKVDDNRLFTAWDRISAGGKKWEPEFDPIVDLLIAGSNQGYNETFDLIFPDCPLTFKNELAFADLAYGWTKLLTFKALDSDGEKKYAEAEKYYRAVLIFGDRLWKFGVYVGPRGAGLKMMDQALSGLEQHFKKAGDDAKAQIAKEMRVPVSDTVKKWRNKVDLIISPMQFQTVGRRDSALPKAADLWNIAENDKDRSWRLSAVMWFGYVKAAKGVSEVKVNDYLDRRAKRERDKKGDITLADKADEAKLAPMDAVNDLQRPPSWSQN